MGKSKVVEELRTQIRELREARTLLRDDIHGFLSDGSLGYGLDEEQIGETLILLATWKAARELSSSSFRLEIATYGLLIFTTTLIVLTAVLAFSTTN